MSKRSWLVLCLLGAGALLVLLSAAGVLGGKVVGQIRGPEWEQLEVNGERYVRCDGAPYTGADRGRFLGLATDGERSFRLYTVRGDSAGQYLYCLWDWEGFFYERA